MNYFKLRNTNSGCMTANATINKCKCIFGTCLYFCSYLTTHSAAWTLINSWIPQSVLKIPTRTLKAESWDLIGSHMWCVWFDQWGASLTAPPSPTSYTRSFSHGAAILLLLPSSQTPHPSPDIFTTGTFSSFILHIQYHHHHPHTHTHTHTHPTTPHL